MVVIVIDNEDPSVLLLIPSNSAGLGHLLNALLNKSVVTAPPPEHTIAHLPQPIAPHGTSWHTKAHPLYTKLHHHCTGASPDQQAAIIEASIGTISAPADHNPQPHHDVPPECSIRIVAG